jgi:hypothetical protein
MTWIGTYDVYQQQGNPLVVKDEDGSYRDFSLEELADAIVEAMNRKIHDNGSKEKEELS